MIGKLVSFLLGAERIVAINKAPFLFEVVAQRFK
tara:strand:- start:90676 stop:90777 length:102 start_codon:yes stop_codon:yes gene_type:complete